MMKNLIPQNNFIFCKACEDISYAGNIQLVNQPGFTTYEVLKIGPKVRSICIGDIIISNATGTRVKINDEYFTLFDDTTIIAKIVKEF